MTPRTRSGAMIAARRPNSRKASRSTRGSVSESSQRKTSPFAIANPARLPSRLRRRPRRANATPLAARLMSSSPSTSAIAAPSAPVSSCAYAATSSIDDCKSALDEAIFCCIATMPDWIASARCASATAPGCAATRCRALRRPSRGTRLRRSPKRAGWKSNSLRTPIGPVRSRTTVAITERRPNLRQASSETRGSASVSSQRRLRSRRIASPLRLPSSGRRTPSAARLQNLRRAGLQEKRVAVEQLEHRARRRDDGKHQVGHPLGQCVADRRGAGKHVLQLDEGRHPPGLFSGVWLQTRRPAHGRSYARRGTGTALQPCVTTPDPQAYDVEESS